MMKNKNILITGGMGFIGSNLANELAKNNNVKIYDIKNGGDIKNFKLLKKELRDIDYVFHFASLISVEESMKKPLDYIENNIIGSLNVLKSSLSCEVKRVIFSSSAAVYGDSTKTPIKEATMLNPKSIYAFTKIAVENLMKIFNENCGLSTISLRFFNVYGPEQKINTSYASVIPMFINRALKNKDLIIYGNGKQTRDFIFIKDIINANILAAKSNYYNTLNIGSGTKTTINNIANLIINLTNSKSKIKYEKSRSGDILHSIANIDKAKKSLNFKPKYNLEKGLKETIEWFKIPSLHQTISL